MMCMCVCVCVRVCVCVCFTYFLDVGYIKRFTQTQRLSVPCTGYVFPISTKRLNFLNLFTETLETLTLGELGVEK